MFKLSALNHGCSVNSYFSFPDILLWNITHNLNHSVLCLVVVVVALPAANWLIFHPADLTAKGLLCNLSDIKDLLLKSWGVILLGRSELLQQHKEEVQKTQELVLMLRLIDV